MLSSVAELCHRSCEYKLELEAIYRQKYLIRNYGDRREKRYRGIGIQQVKLFSQPGVLSGDWGISNNLG